MNKVRFKIYSGISSYLGKSGNFIVEDEWKLCNRIARNHTKVICNKNNYYIYCYRGNKFLELPYAVKGMDVSFSGLLSYIEVSYKS